MPECWQTPGPRARCLSWWDTGAAPRRHPTIKPTVVAAALSTAMNAERQRLQALDVLYGSRYIEGKSPVSEYFEEALASVSELCVELDAFDPDRW